MKKIILSLFLSLFFITPAFAAQWCQWSGTEAENCISERDGILYPDNHFPVKIEGNETKIYNYGYYPLVITQPTIGENQVKDAEIWGFADNEISKTWSVRDLTQTEIDERDAEAMDITMYYLIKGLISIDTFTLQEAAAFFPAESITAYQARTRLEE